MWHKADWMGHPVRLELTLAGLQVKLANHYTTRGALFEIELTIGIKMDLALNNLQGLICHKTNQPTFRSLHIVSFLSNLNLLSLFLSLNVIIFFFFLLIYMFFYCLHIIFVKIFIFLFFSIVSIFLFRNILSVSSYLNNLVFVHCLNTISSLPFLNIVFVLLKIFLPPPHTFFIGHFPFLPYINILYHLPTFKYSFFPFIIDIYFFPFFLFLSFHFKKKILLLFQ